MPKTVISSKTKEVIIGSEQPFVIIGERINPTGRKLLAEEWCRPVHGRRHGWCWCGRKPRRASRRAIRGDGSGLGAARVASDV